MQPLATTDDYELLIGPVPDEELPRLEYNLEVASSVVASVAPGVLPWYTYDPDDPELDDPGPVPKPVVMVTCQTAASLMATPTGGSGAVTMERVGLVQTMYAEGTDTYGILPAAWKLTLKPWRTDMGLASVKLTTHDDDPLPVDWWQRDMDEELA